MITYVTFTPTRSIFKLHTCVLPWGGVILNQTHTKDPLAELVKGVLQVTTVGEQSLLPSLHCCCGAVLVPPHQSIQQERLKM